MLTASCDQVLNSAGSSALYGKFRNSASGFLHHLQSAFRPRKHRQERLTEVFSAGKSRFFRCLLTAPRWLLWLRRESL